METIKITIPDNLSHEEELFAIAKELGKKLLPGNTRKLLGAGYTIKHIETNITIIREPVEKVIATQSCNLCSTIFELSLGKKLYTNYGGRVKKLFYCSDNCRDNVINWCGDGRAALTRNKLKSFVNFNK